MLLTVLLRMLLLLLLLLVVLLLLVQLLQGRRLRLEGGLPMPGFPCLQHRHCHCLQHVLALEAACDRHSVSQLDAVPDILHRLDAATHTLHHMHRGVQPGTL